MKKSGSVRNSFVIIVFIILVSAFLFSSVTYANAVTTWAKIYGGSYNDSISSIKLTKDGGYIAAGMTLSFGAGGVDSWILKLDQGGNIQWQKTYGGSSYDSVYVIQQTLDEGYIMAGSSFSYGTGWYDAWILKLDSSGTIQWQKIYSAGSSISKINSIQQTPDGGYIAVADVSDKLYGDASLLKLDGNGNIQWQKTYHFSNDNRFNAVQLTSDGGYIVAGSIYTLYRNYGDVWVLKFDSNGNNQWQKTYGGSSSEFAYDVKQTIDGGYIVAGKTYSFGAGFYDSWILKLDADGAVQWQKTYGGSGDDSLNSIQQTSDGGYIASGHSTSFNASYQDNNDLFVLKIDASGDIQWQKTYGDSNTDFSRYFESANIGENIQQTTDGGYIVADYARDSGVRPYPIDIWVLKLDSYGYISGCATEFIRDSDATVVNTDAVVKDVVATELNITISPQTSNGNVADTNVTPYSVCYAADPDISVNPTSLDFGAVELPSSFSQPVTISNSGSASLAISAITIEGENASAFSQTNNCGTVEADGSCYATVTFTPISIGIKTATLSIDSDDPDTPTAYVPLMGEGIDIIPPTVSISTSSNFLWPPNHKMVDVVVGGSATDDGAGIASVEITVTDEYGAYNMTVPAFGSTIQLEAWRAGTDKDGRKYTITAVATDNAGNRSMADTIVLVPHDMRK